MKTLIVFLGLILSTELEGQVIKERILSNGIYLSDSDYIRHHFVYGFNKKKGRKLRDNDLYTISIKMDAQTYKFYHDEIWGYRKDDIDWRIYDRDSYRIDYVGKVCVYTLYDGMPGSISSFSYFSTDLKAPLHFLNRKNLVTIFHSNKNFVERLQNFPITKSITKWDKVNRCYRFVNWL